jgi:anti-sigma factor RsiW
MTDFSAKLSAYLDNELNDADMLAVEARLQSDPTAQAELDALMAAEGAITDQFDAMLRDPVPLALARQINALPLPRENRPAIWPSRSLLAASLAMFIVGGTAGYVAKGQFFTPVVVQSGWLTDIADYQAIYAGQTRHLVEVAASEPDHIEKWLGTNVGTTFSIPDLTQQGLTFQGGRLLVANGKPVAQLMYTTANGTVIALCFQKSASGVADDTAFLAKTINGFDMVTWSDHGADYVVIGPEKQPSLDTIAKAAAAVI